MGRGAGVCGIPDNTVAAEAYRPGDNLGSYRFLVYYESAEVCSVELERREHRAQFF